jgi:hypothetical protein
MTRENPAVTLATPPHGASHLAALPDDADVQRLVAAIGLGALAYRSFANAPVRRPPVVAAAVEPPAILAEAEPPVLPAEAELPAIPAPSPVVSLPASRVLARRPAAADAVPASPGRAAFPLLAEAFRHDPDGLPVPPSAPAPAPPAGRAPMRPPAPAGGTFRLVRAALAQGEQH